MSLRTKQLLHKPEQLMKWAAHPLCNNFPATWNLWLIFFVVKINIFNVTTEAAGKQICAINSAPLSHTQWWRGQHKSLSRRHELKRTACAARPFSGRKCKNEEKWLKNSLICPRGRRLGSQKCGRARAARTHTYMLKWLFAVSQLNIYAARDANLGGRIPRKTNPREANRIFKLQLQAACCCFYYQV